MTDSNFAFSLKRIAFDEDYSPADNTRITTNFANLARGESRQENLRNTLRMIDNRFNLKRAAVSEEMPTAVSPFPRKKLQEADI